MLPPLISREEFADVAAGLADTPLRAWCDVLPARLSAATAPGVHGKLERWHQCLADLPRLQAGCVALQDAVVIGDGADADDAARARLRACLEPLIPWRKGPFTLFGLDLDTEWRCDLKWARVAPHVTSLAGRRVLDVGCGNGYYALRMAAQGPRLVLGLDPYLLYFMQFRALRPWLTHGPAARVHILPLALEDLPTPGAAFDTVFSMGVLYHRRSPFDHLALLRRALHSGGELVLETLIIDGGPQAVQVPADRYASMRNVWFLPSADALLAWLERVGFVRVREVHRCWTTPEEQRRTAWMPFRSLADFLDPADPRRTREGYPAPMRAVFVAENP